MVAGLGSRFFVTETAIKPFSVGYPIQAPLDAFLTLLREHGLNESNVESIVVRLPEDGARIVNNRSMPDINCQHIIAVALVDGSVSFEDSHSYERMADPKVRAVKERVQLIADRELMDPAAPRSGRVEVKLRDGRTVSHFTRHAPGTKENPLDTESVNEKARLLMAPVLGDERTEEVIRAGERPGSAGRCARATAIPARSIDAARVESEDEHDAVLVDADDRHGNRARIARDAGARAGADAAARAHARRGAQPRRSSCWAMACTARPAPGRRSAGKVPARSSPSAAEVTGFKSGDRVMGRCSGAFSEYALMEAAEAMAVPPALSWEEAASIPLTFLVSYDMLVLQGRLKSGEWLLINGVSSGVGVASLQLGKVLGAKVIGTSGSAAQAGGPQAARARRRPVYALR